MAKLSDPRGFRKTVAGVCMIASPALVVVSQIIHPREFSDEAKWLAEISSNTDRQYWAHLLGLSLSPSRFRRSSERCTC